jgi:hypothetical protein
LPIVTLRAVHYHNNGANILCCQPIPQFQGWRSAAISRQTCSYDQVLPLAIRYMYVLMMSGLSFGALITRNGLAYCSSIYVEVSLFA